MDLERAGGRGVGDPRRGGRAVHRRPPRRFGGAQEGQRLRHRGRPGDRTPGGRRAGDGHRHRRARRGVRRRRLDSPWVWVLDPIDGTFNYAAGSPMAAILLGLLHDGEPVAGLTWLPFTDQRYTAVAGGPLMKNGVPQPSLAPVDLADALIGVGTFNADSRGRFPGRYRLAVLENLSRVCRGCGCTAPPASTWPTSPPESSAGQSVSATTSGTTRRAWRWCGPRAASSPTWPANRGPRLALGAGRGARCARPDPRDPAQRRQTGGLLNVLRYRPCGAGDSLPGRRRRPGGQGGQLRKPA